VNADHVHLMQVVLNLCLNARDAMPEGGDLTIYLKNIGPKIDNHDHGELLQDCCVKLTVSDTGKGISELPFFLIPISPPRSLEKEWGWV